jgi:hypothetical protein
MKHLLPSLIALSLGASACGQKHSEVTPPEVVMNAFKEQFPKAEHVSWSMEDKTDYEADLKMDGMKYSVKYTATGVWMETEHAIKMDALPAAVRQTLAAQYAEYKLDDAEVAETPSGTVYEVDMEKGEEEMEVIFNAEGQVLKSTVEQEGGKEEDND